MWAIRNVEMKLQIDAKLVTCFPPNAVHFFFMDKNHLDYYSFSTTYSVIKQDKDSESQRQQQQCSRQCLIFPLQMSHNFCGSFHSFSQFFLIALSVFTVC